MADERARLVSVIMPCRNAGPMLRPALQSVTEQTYPHVEIIFVDNNSTDDSLATAEQVARITTRPFQIFTCAEPGANNARNWGYGFARGDYIQWMDADDRLDPDKIALQVAALEQDSTADVAYGDWTANRCEPGKRQFALRQNLRQETDQVYRVLAGVWYPPHLYLLRREAAQRLQDVQGWWPSRMCATDIEYSAIAALLGLQFRYVAGAHVYYNVWSANQISGSTPYPVRVAALEAIFRRLLEFAGSGRANVTLDARHKTLLNQGWGIWHMPRNSVSFANMPGGLVRIRNVRTGNEIELRQSEAAIANALSRISQPSTSFHLALTLIDMVPGVTRDPATVVEAIELFQRTGFLEQVAIDPAKPTGTSA